MPIRILIYFLMIFMSCSLVYSEPSARHKISGTIRDSSSGDIMGFVTVKIKNIQTGTFSNSRGYFELNLFPGTYQISFSFVGYKTENKEVIIDDKNVYLEVFLKPSSVELPQIEVIAEDPGARLMRKVIKKKQEKMDSLKTYSYSLYTKFVASTDTLTAGRTDRPADTTIVSIFESYSLGYFKKPDLYYNEIIQRRQSANVPPQANYVAYGTNLNAFDDYVNILNEEIATPFHPDALDFYDFTLVGELEDSEKKIEKIRAQPISNFRKLFDGYVYIDAEKLGPVLVDLIPNKAVKLPFDAKLSYYQTFEDVGNGFFLPKGLRIFSSLQADLFWILSPRLDIKIETSAFDYKVNIPLDNSLFSRRRVEINDFANKFDTAFWNDNIIIPLRIEELQAYQAIQSLRDNPDSLEGTNVLEKIFGPVVNFIAQFTRPPFTGLEDVIRYNRVNGFTLGAGLKFRPFERGELSLYTAYPFSSNIPILEGNIKFFLDKNELNSFNFSAYKTLSRIDNPNIVKYPAITILSLLSKNDYGDYYYRNGFEFSAGTSWGQLRFLRREVFVRPSSFNVFFRYEEHKTAYNNTNFAIFNSKSSFRDNPQIIEGLNSSLGFEFNLNFHPYRRLTNLGFHLHTEHSNPKILGSDFNFTRIYSSFNVRTRTLPLWRLDLRLSGGLITGEAPPQKFFSLESAVSNFATESAFRGLLVKEFYGDKYIAMSMEHNFGEIIPGVFRIPNIASFGIEFITLANIGWTDFSEKTRHYLESYNIKLPNSTSQTSDGLYFEAGIALNRLLLFLRFDLVARFSQTSKPKLMFSISGAQW